MRSSIISISAIAVASGILVVAACSTSFESEGAHGSTSSAVRTVTEVPGSAECPQSTTPLCRIRIGTEDGGPPRPSDQCAPLIEIIPMGGGTAFTWRSPEGQLVDAVVVESSLGGSNIYAYAPPVSSDSDLLVVPGIDGGEARLNIIWFCAPRNADGGPASDARADAPTDASTDAPADAPSADAHGPKTW